MQTVMGVKKDFEEVDGEPVQGVKVGGDVFISPNSHSGLSQHMLVSLKALARSTDESCVTGVQPSGDKGMDELLSHSPEETWQEFGDITLLEEESFSMGSNLTYQICHGRTEEQD